MAREDLLFLALDEPDERDTGVEVTGDQVGESIEAVLDRECVDVVLRERGEPLGFVIRGEEPDLCGVVQHVLGDEPQSVVSVRVVTTQVLDDHVAETRRVYLRRRDAGEQNTRRLRCFLPDRVYDLHTGPVRGRTP
ncbi:hypothetical protein [Halobaculum litoreum]|uniref:hypothetical protein n=1 Tax=Halobaculum litoreum TaxID=3031998 RepID=UPI0024C389E2|nr:hypothetical protein [Halobaculum sp. DT92]